MEKRKSTQASEMIVEKMSEKTSGETSEKILLLLSKNPQMTSQELAREIKITQRSIERNIKTLKDSGKLTRIGPDKGGYWKVK